MTPKIAKGQKFGDWQLQEYLGGGGNGFVWLARNSSADEAAIKILAKIEGKSKEKVYARFRSEVQVVQANCDIDGLLPIVDFYLPDEIVDATPWYVMPVAQSLDKFLDGRIFETAVQVVLEIGKTLINLHERGICHRDIKPANILVRDGKFYLSDFGLADYPEKADLTSTGEQIGAKWTIAPEMKRNSNEADGRLADVYSLAKTLWILLTGHKDGFEGQYNPDSVNGLSRLGLTEPDPTNGWVERAPLVYLKPLDDLLTASTDDDPSHRPPMSQFVERLDVWDKTYKDFKKRNPLQWQDVQTKLFPAVVPQRAIWINIDSIIEILNYLGSIDGLNHMHMPDGGGLDLLGAELGLEPDTIELIVGNNRVCIVRPKRLIFENFDYDWEWNYFRLETGDLEVTGIGTIDCDCESLYEIAPLQYISKLDWHIDREMERKYPANSRGVFRYVDGDFLVLQKTSTYNGCSTYTGGHNRFGSDEFRDYISGKVRLVQKMRQDEVLVERAKESGLTMDEVVRNYLGSVFRQEYLAERGLEDPL